MFQDMIDSLLASTVVDLSETSLTVHCFDRSWKHSVCHVESQHVELVPATVHVVLGLAVYPVHYGVQHWVEVLEGEGVGLEGVVLAVEVDGIEFYNDWVVPL